VKKKAHLFVSSGLVASIAVLMAGTAFAQATRPVVTNKDKLLTVAVQGQIVPAQPSTSWVTTWDGKSKLAIGMGGINYNLKVGEKAFGWASGDRATVGVSTGGSDERTAGSWLTHTSIGNEVRILSGAARGEKGVVVGKFGSFVQVHFDDAVLERLAIGDKLHVKASGLGLELQGFKDVFPHGIAPEILEKIASQTADGAIEVPVVAEVPAEIMGQGSGRGSLSGHWNIQTTYPPDITKYKLDQLRFGDLVLLKDIQTDYGMGYFKGGATLGVVVSGPSDISGLGVGVTPILSSRSVQIRPRIDPTANIGKFLGIRTRQLTSLAPEGSNGPSNGAAAAQSRTLRTNEDRLIITAVDGVVQPPREASYSTTYDGRPKTGIGTASINYTVSIGDLAYGWATADHVEPDVTIQGRDKPVASECALAILACIGNEATVVSGDAAGGKGVFIGRHAGAHDMVWFPPDVLEKLTLYDRIQIKAKGVGLQIDGFDDVRVNKLSPELLQKLGISIADKQLVVPVVMEIPGHIMGSGMGGEFLATVDYDIQTTDPAIVEKYDLKKLRLGDVIAIRDHYNYWGRGRYEGAVTIGVVIHGWSDYAGHGPGVNPVLSALPGRIATKIEPDANVAYYLGIRRKGN
jgi:hypothetical protein